jgi:hypothetical protein
VIALAIAAFATVITLVGIIVWSVRRGDRFVDELLIAKDRSVKQTLTAERATFEADKANAAFIAERTRAEALTDFVSHYAGSTDANGDLDPDDVDGRVLRIARWWGQANARDPLPALPAGAVRDRQSAGASDADVLPRSERPGSELMRPED